ncbi:MAG: alpha/beta fold hydrolase [Sedimentisphaerales bacterium]|nr:alpha/beta fold hydrolase [Sedimentisphaerales bacterium]
MKKLFLYLGIALMFSGCNNNSGQVRPVPYANWESASVKSNGIRIHYWRTGGTGKPVMIMAHGITDYGLSFSSLAEKFQNDYDIIMYDARGHGFSEKPESRYSLTDHVEDLVGLIRALNIEKPVLFGHSMGAWTVALTGATYPDLPRAIIMEDPPLARELKFLKEINISLWKDLIETDRTTSKKNLMNHARSKRHPGLSDFEYDHWAEAKLLACPNVVNVIKDESLREPNQVYPKIIAPALILKADADQDNRKNHIETAKLLQNGKIVHFDGASHLVRLDSPVETERQVRAFLAELDK